jgi:hypothetical protein
VGSLVSIFGVLVFFWVLVEIIVENNLFFQQQNSYVVALHTYSFFLPKDKSRDLYVFNKYSFFDTKNAGDLFL